MPPRKPRGKLEDVGAKVGRRRGYSRRRVVAPGGTTRHSSPALEKEPRACPLLDAAFAGTTAKQVVVPATRRGCWRPRARPGPPRAGGERTPGGWSAGPQRRLPPCAATLPDRCLRRRTA